MGQIRKNYIASFKAKVALETVKKEKTISQLFRRLSKNTWTALN